MQVIWLYNAHIVYDKILLSYSIFIWSNTMITIFYMLKITDNTYVLGKGFYAGSSFNHWYNQIGLP